MWAALHMVGNYMIAAGAASFPWNPTDYRLKISI
jgi:hypothetical protein